MKEAYGRTLSNSGEKKLEPKPPACYKASLAFSAFAMNRSFAKSVLCAIGCAFLFSIVGLSTATAETLFRIGLIRETTSQNLIQVGREWRKNLPKRMQVTLRVGEDMPARGVTVKAYFYDKDEKLVFTASAPNAIWANTPSGFKSVSVPSEIKRNIPFDVYFALPEALTKAKWKTMVVVFGKGDDMVARARPATMLEKVKFKEKAMLATEKL